MELQLGDRLDAGERRTRRGVNSASDTGTRAGLAGWGPRRSEAGRGCARGRRIAVLATVNATPRHTAPCMAVPAHARSAARHDRQTTGVAPGNAWTSHGPASCSTAAVPAARQLVRCRRSQPRRPPSPGLVAESAHTSPRPRAGRTATARRARPPGRGRGKGGALAGPHGSESLSATDCPEGRPQPSRDRAHSRATPIASGDYAHRFALKTSAHDPPGDFARSRSLRLDPSMAWKTQSGRTSACFTLARYPSYRPRARRPAPARGWSRCGSAPSCGRGSHRAC